MKKLYYFLFAAVTAIFSFVSCNQNPVEPEVTEDTYPRKLLVEHFTGQACGYCPAGMEYIQQFIAKQGAENVIWLSNHSGYSDDKYTIKDSKLLASKFRVSGAPSVMLNREKQSYRDEETGRKVQNMVFHPYYLTTMSSFELTSPASVSLTNSYDATTRQLSVEVSGTTAAGIDSLFIVVAIKESGLHGVQADFYNTWEGWQDFVHNHALRAYLTDILGEKQYVNNRRYTFSVNEELSKDWSADNCSVVAYLINADGAVINAEQAPVVEGTKGGEDIQGGGVKEVEVPETYPEYEQVPQAATNVISDEVIFFPNGQTKEGYSYILIVYPSETRVYSYIPLFYTNIILAEEVDALPDGTYTFETSGMAGTAVAGMRDDNRHQLSGSMFLMADPSYFNQGYLAGQQWLLTTGSIVVSSENNTNSITITATTAIGSNLTATYEQPISTEEPTEVAPLRLIRKR